MSLPGKIIGFVVVIAVAGAAGYGIYYRLNSSDESGSSTDSVSNGPVAGVSADSAFSTDLPIPVEGAPVIAGDLVLEVRASGQAAATRGTTLRSQVAGQVVSVPVRENARVGAGALLVRLDSAEIQLNLDDARASLARAEATFRELTIGDDRITDPALREERRAAARIRAGLDQAEVAVRRAEFDLARTRITAPFGGRVASVQVVQGQYVSAGEELLQVLDIDPIRVEVQVLESEIGHLSVGGSARMTFAAFPGEQFTGRIETKNPLVDNVTRQARVTVSVPNPEGRILPGMYANVVLDARHIPNSILVPIEAVLERDVDRRTMLFVFDGENTEGLAEWRYVTTGLRNSEYVQIIESEETDMVRPGEIVLVGGHMMLTHGARVQLTENVRAVEGGRPR
jgi:membrane fusion protein (multidrug efflux system)